MRAVVSIAVTALLIATNAVAQQQASDNEIKAAFSGKTVEWGSDGVADYKTDGSYEYFSIAQGKNFRGKYSVVDGSLCADFANGLKRCDKILKDDKGFYMMNKGFQYRAKIR
jgi:hypothetical protein